MIKPVVAKKKRLTKKRRIIYKKYIKQQIYRLTSYFFKIKNQVNNCLI